MGTSTEKILDKLLLGKISLVGQFTWGSNHTFLVDVGSSSEKSQAVYKPQRGERSLWDFPEETLTGREVAAFLVGKALGWDLVPPTVFRDDGPFGPGSLQLRVDHDPRQHYFTFDETTRQRLRPVAMFDVIVNNADRKGGHILMGNAGRIWLIDHGVCFHVEPKLRTVVWDFVGEPIPKDLLTHLQSLKSQLNKGLRRELAAFLSPEEMSALQERVANLLENPVFPAPSERERSTPWPLV